MKFEQGISVILKAYNEEENIGRVLEAISGLEFLDEIIVVNDGSSDRTAEVAGQYAGDRVRVVTNEKNLGMGGAMARGVQEAEHDLVMFLDSDLVGLSEDHILKMLAPIIFTKEADLVLGVFGLKELSIDTSTKIANRMLPLIAGQRVIWKHCLPPLERMAESRYGADLLIARHVPRKHRVVVKLDGLSQVTKEQKANGDFVKAFRARMKMYQEVSKVMRKDKSVEKKAKKRAKSLG